MAAGVALVLLLWLFGSMYLFEGGYYNAWLFRGGFLFVGLCTIVVIAAATHRSSRVGRVLGAPFLRWVGTRSYGLYLFHIPIYAWIDHRYTGLGALGLTALRFAVVGAVAFFRSNVYAMLKPSIGECWPLTLVIARSMSPMRRDVRALIESAATPTSALIASRWPLSVRAAPRASPSARVHS